MVIHWTLIYILIYLKVGVISKKTNNTVSLNNYLFKYKFSVFLYILGTLIGCISTALIAIVSSNAIELLVIGETSKQIPKMVLIPK